MAFIPDVLRRYYPGVLLAAVLALAAQFISDHYGAPTMLLALLFGMAFNFLSKEGACVDGINLSAKKVLRIGVALLGARISFDMIANLGIGNVALAILAVIFTIGFGLALGRVLSTRRSFAFLTSGAVAICGASAAMAIAAILPQSKRSDEELVFTVAGVTVFSTIAMVLYPVLGQQIGLNGVDLGVFLGATIHDVAQVVGAGYSVDEPTGDTATIVKLLRVAMLAPVVVIASLFIRARNQTPEDGKRPPILPGFILGFMLLVGLNSLSLITQPILEFFAIVSRWALVMAIAAVGMKIDLGEMTRIGRTAFLMIIGETVFVALFVAIGLQI